MHPDFKKLIYTFILSVTILSVFAQSGIKGTIRSTEGQIIPFSTIYIKELKTGTVANENGYYEYSLPAGTYHVEYRCLGFQSLTKQLSISDKFTLQDVKLENQSIQLKAVNIVSTTEDPAYAIMRKAVAASRYYRMLVKSFDTEVYIKGAGEIKIPKFVAAMAKSEGIDTVENFVSESVNQLHYEYPSTYKQKVISARTNDKDTGNSMVNNFINASIYEPQFAGIVSPLSPSAFSYYRFKLINTIKDKNQEIYQIQVIPKGNDASLFKGDIYIAEKLWCVYSFQLSTYLQGFKVAISQMFAAVNDRMWFPINHQYDLSGRIFGVKMKWKYLATLSNYKVELNESLKYDKLVLIDEKTEREYAQTLQEERRLRKQDQEKQPDTTILKEEEDKFSLSDFRKQMKEYEKQAKKEKKEPEIVADYSMEIDSLAFRKNTAFWDSIRPVPLTTSEQKRGLGYKMDSIREVRKSDTANQTGIFGKTLGGLIFGKTFYLSKNWKLVYPSPLVNLNFNTVEGYNLDIPLQFRYLKKGVRIIQFGPEIRYGFSNREWNISGNVNYYFSRALMGKGLVKLSGGREIRQFNNENPIFPIINSVTSLLGVKNYMKIYRNDFLKLTYNTPLNYHLQIESSVEWASRSALENHSNESWVRKKGRIYTPNAPYNIEDSVTAFPEHQAFVLKGKLNYRPIVKFVKRNGVKMPVTDLFPLLSLEYQGGIKGIFGSDVDYHRLEGSIRHQFEGHRRTLDFKLFAGKTFGANQLYFMDYKHFTGNHTALILTDPLNSYRLLDYYTYSTKDYYYGAFSTLTLNRFLLSRIFWLNISGVKESLSFNYLKTANSTDYVELGYGLENILKIFKIEAFTRFENGKYKEFGIKLGISTSGAIRFEHED
jgi:hypothetical protein